MTLTTIFSLCLPVILAAVGLAYYVGAYRANSAWAKRAAELEILRSVIHHIPFPLFAKDVADDYTYIVANKAAEYHFGIKSSEITQRKDNQLFPARMAELFREMDKSVMKSGKILDIEAEAVTTAKGPFISHTIKVPIYNAKGEPQILLGIFEDITEKSKITTRLLQAKNRAEQSDRTKSEFLANMSHELRTPLNSILGMSRLLRESNLTEDQRMMAQTIFGSSSTLLEIVNDILDLSKIESGIMKLEEIGFDLTYIQNSLVDRLNPLAIEKNLNPIKIEDSVPPYVLGDPLRLTRVLTNLISNAIKYSERGQITVKISHTNASSKAIFYRCEVSDQGIGIPPEHHERIFDKFVQGDNSTTRRYGGTGLGLAITKQLVELMGGFIDFTSTPGEGSKFWVEIPFNISDRVYREKVGNRSMQPQNSILPTRARVLIAEDNRVNQAVAEKLMERFKIANFSIVDNGIQAVDRYRTGNWDLILMDCHMPDMSGYDATTAIRALERVSGVHIPIVAMTANAMVGDKEKCISCGMDDYLSKPVIFEEMAKVLGQWINLQGEEKQTHV